MTASPLDDLTRLACRMFAGHTGLSREQIIAFFRGRLVDVSAVPDEHPRRRVALLHCLGQLDTAARLDAVGGLLSVRGMRHGHPGDADRRRLRELLDNASTSA